MKLFLIGGMEDLNFNYCYKIFMNQGKLMTDEEMSCQ